MLHKGKLYYRYGGWFRTYEGAAADLEDSYAMGDVSSAEGPEILSAIGRDGKRWYAVHLEDR